MFASLTSKSDGRSSDPELSLLKKGTSPHAAGVHVPAQVRRALQGPSVVDGGKSSADIADGGRPSFMSSPRSSSSTPITSHNRSLNDLDKSAPAARHHDDNDHKPPISWDRGGTENQTLEGKDKKKSSSFLSRIIGTTIKRDSFYNDRERDISENESQISDLRPEGMDAQLFSHNINNIGFNPRHPPPPAYIKVRTKNKKVKEFDHTFLAQELDINKDPTLHTPVSGRTLASGGHNAIWAVEFSQSGKYLAVGSQDGIVRIYAVLGTSDDRRQFEADQQDESDGARLHAPVFHRHVFRQYAVHNGPITDLNWSKNDFLVSASQDKTVRLWHPSRNECLCTFKHKDHVLSVRFHPQDDRFFLAGCRDSKLRLWSIPDKSVAYWTQLTEPITAVAFTPDGKQCMAGTLVGACYFFTTEGLKQTGRLIAKSTHGKNAKGSKIHGIDAFYVYRNADIDNQNEQVPDEVRILISSADSRLRLYNLSDRTLETKFKGHKAEELPIRAAVSDCGAYFVAGSEDRAAHIWTNGPPEKDAKNAQRPMELFAAHNDKTTVLVMAPVKTRQLLAKSHDPIYDLCNPPPVTLLSRSESMISSQPPTDNGSVQESPPRRAKATGSVFDNHHANSPRSTHMAGHIIVAASNYGLIRVYRQDCAHAKRRAFDRAETSSVFSAGKRPSSIVATRAMSNAGVSRSNSVSTQPPQDRILSWRQGISSVGSFDRNRAGSTVSAPRQPSDHSAIALRQIQQRDNSPRKSVGSASMLSAKSRQVRNSDPFSTESPTRNQSTTSAQDTGLTESPTRTTTNGSDARIGLSGSPLRNASNSNAPSSSVEESTAESETDAASSEQDPLMLAGGKSYMFWDPRAYLNMGNSRPGLAPNRRRSSVVSAVSRLSSEDEDEMEKGEVRDSLDHRFGEKTAKPGKKVTK